MSEIDKVNFYNNQEVANMLNLLEGGGVLKNNKHLSPAAVDIKKFITDFNKMLASYKIFNSFFFLRDVIFEIKANANSKNPKGDTSILKLTIASKTIAQNLKTYKNLNIGMIDIDRRFVKIIEKIGILTRKDIIKILELLEKYDKVIDDSPFGGLELPPYDSVDLFKNDFIILPDTNTLKASEASFLTSKYYEMFLDLVIVNSMILEKFLIIKNIQQSVGK